jgi:hypothetical protein
MICLGRTRFQSHSGLSLSKQLASARMNKRVGSVNSPFVLVPPPVICRTGESLRFILAASLVYLTLTLQPTAAQSVVDEAPEANPGRPTVSTPATITPAGYLQFETGFVPAYQSPEFSSRYSLSEVMKLSVLLVLASADVKGFHYDANAFFTELEQGPVRRGQFGQSLTISHQFLHRFTLSGEIWHFTQPFLNSNAVGNLWAVGYSARKTLVFDAGFNHGLTGTSTGWEAFVGFTYLLPHRLWKVQ